MQCDETPPDDFVAQEPLALRRADPLSRARAHLRLRATLARLAIRDPLTGLFQRRSLAESRQHAVRRTARHGMPLGVIMRDVDHFQRFNDPFGPGPGATLLTSRAQLRRSRTRAGGIASRSGGAEFPLVLPEAPLASTCGCAAPLRGAVQPLPVPDASRSLGSLTRSRGVFRFPPPGSSARSLLPAADRALDAAQHGGRDRVAVEPAI